MLDQWPYSCHQGEKAAESASLPTSDRPPGPTDTGTVRPAAPPTPAAATAAADDDVPAEDVLSTVEASADAAAPDVDVVVLADLSERVDVPASDTAVLFVDVGASTAAPTFHERSTAPRDAALALQTVL